MKNPCNTAEIVRLIQADTETAHLKAWRCLRQDCVPKMKGKLFGKGLTNEQDIEQVQQETMIALFQNILKGKFRGEAEISTYYIGIAYNIWKKLLENKNKAANLSQNSEIKALTLLETIEVYLDGNLNPTEKAAFQSSLQTDSNLQEMVEAVRLGKPTPQPWFAFDEAIDVIAEENPERDAEDMEEVLEKMFKEGDHCPKLLTDYYFVYEGSYEKMAHAEKRKREDYQPVYERVKKRVQRCLNAIKGKLNRETTKKS